MPSVRGRERTEAHHREIAGEAIARLDEATAAFMAEYLPKLEREVPKLEHEPDRRVREAELLRELVIHHFETAARECTALYASVAEFEAELRAGIARFVQFRVGQYQWLSDAMRNELDAGFTFFSMRANPWAGISEADRASRWHVGAIIGEALSHTSLKLIAAATARAAQSSPDKKLNGATEPKPDESSGVEATPQFPKRAIWLKAKLEERQWTKHDLERHRGPEHRTTQKILDGLNVQGDVLRKVVTGLQSKLSLKGRNLPAVSVSDIPND